jgi:hypothetical protein
VFSLDFKKMVHKKYIIKKGKKFGPYLYENYRENGKTKTRYLGKYKEKKNPLKNPLVLFGFFALLAIIFIGLAYISYDPDIKFEKDLEEFPSFSFSASVNVIGEFPPKLLISDTDLWLCENKRLDFDFNVSSQNGLENLTVGLSPKDPFFMEQEFNCYPDEEDENLLKCNLWSWDIEKEMIRNPLHDFPKISFNEGETIYHEVISAAGKDGMDSKVLDIHLIEINNPPKIEDLDLKTLEIWKQGENSSYYKKLSVEDVELAEGIFPESQFEFNYTFLNNTDFILGDPNIFNRDTGTINISGENINPGWYKIEFCVNDRGLDEYSSNFAVCEGSSWWRS